MSGRGADHSTREGPATVGPLWTRRALVWGTVALLVGLWLLVESLGVDAPEIARHWPLFPILGGLASLADWALVSRRPGAAGKGAAAVAFGAAVYPFTLERRLWFEAWGWWPVIPGILAVGCLATWAAGRFRSTAALVLGLLFAGVAVTGWVWGEVPATGIWAVVFLAIGAWMVFRAVARRRG